MEDDTDEAKEEAWYHEPCFLFVSMLSFLLIEEELIIALLVVLVSINDDRLVLRRSVRLPR